MNQPLQPSQSLVSVEFTQDGFFIEHRVCAQYGCENTFENKIDIRTSDDNDSEIMSWISEKVTTLVRRAQHQTDYYRCHKHEGKFFLNKEGKDYLGNDLSTYSEAEMRAVPSKPKWDFEKECEEEGQRFTVSSITRDISRQFS